MADCVIGVSGDEEVPLIHEAISGPFDCDKLDYMTRDALMCGVPIVTDVTRLIQKVRAVTVTTENLPEGIAAAVQDRGLTHTIVAVARSGASTLHEVSLGRSLMHDKIYRHHKVRATEAMVASIVGQMGSALDEYSPMIPLAIHDDQLLSLDRARIAELASAAPTAVTELQVDVAADLAMKLRNRDLFVRAFAFAQKMPFDAYKDDPTQRAAIEQLIRDADVGDTRAELTRKIVDQVVSIAAAVGEDAVLDLFPGRDPFPYIWIDPPVVKKKSESDTDQSRAYLIDDGRRLVAMGTVSAETRGWADAYINTRDVGYVFCPRELAALVHVATEVVLRVERNITIPREMHSYAKVEPNRADGVREHLSSAGYYNTLPRDLRPLPDFLTRANTSRRIQKAAERLAGYMGSNPRRDQNKAQSGVMNPAKIRDWVAQFDDDADLALTLVESVLVLDRETINEAVDAFLASSGGEPFRHGALVPIGQAKDGSAIVTYYSGDVAASYGCEVLSLPDALATDRPIVFIDDIIQQGSSVVSIFNSWMGAEDSEDLGEARPGPLPDNLRSELRQRPLAIVTSAGFPAGADHIKSNLDKLGLTVDVYSHLAPNALPTIDSALAGTDSVRAAAFVEKLRAVGLEVRKGLAKPEERALGYGNAGLLVISTFNTPTMTATALWKDGEVDSAPWRALFPRRPKR
jgi:hypothetical protein